MIVDCGLSGSGKSTVARRLADRLGFEWLRSDEIRKRVAGVAPAERLSESYAAGAYSREFTEKTYAALLGGAAARLHDGAGVIVDATFAAPPTAPKRSRSPRALTCRCCSSNVSRVATKSCAG